MQQQLKITVRFWLMNDLRLITRVFLDHPNNCYFEKYPIMSATLIAPSILAADFAIYNETSKW